MDALTEQEHPMNGPHKYFEVIHHTNLGTYRGCNQCDKPEWAHLQRPDGDHNTHTFGHELRCYYCDCRPGGRVAPWPCPYNLEAWTVYDLAMLGLGPEDWQDERVCGNAVRAAADMTPSPFATPEGVALWAVAYIEAEH